MEQRLTTDKVTKLVLFVLILCIPVCLAVYVYKGGYTGWDIRGHWRICRYALEGLNPYLLIGETPALEAVGEIPAGFSTVPWACVFGSVFYGGFLPFHIARIYTLTLHFAALIAACIVLYKTFQDAAPGKAKWCLVLLPCVHFSFMYSVHYGNAGGIICCLLLIAFCISDRWPMIAGVLLGLAMMKPQIAAIICFAFLLRKQWKALFVAAAIVIGGWAVSAWMTATEPLTLLKQTLEYGTAAPTQYLGLLNNLKYAGVDSTLILLLNMLLGCGYTAGLMIYLKKKCPTTNSMFAFVPACLASVFWIYKNGTDYLIVTYAAVFFVLLLTGRKMAFWETILSLAAMLFLQMSRCAVYLGMTLAKGNLFVSDLYKSVDGLVIAVIGIYLCHLWAKYNGDALLEKKSQ